MEIDAICRDVCKTYLNRDIKAILSESMTITEHVKKLAETIESLNKELQKQVLEHHDDLLRQASHATKLELVLNVINMHIQNLFANAERLKSQLDLPYETLEKHINVLRNLNSASHILRQVGRVQQLSKRLANTNDSVQKASILLELEELATDQDLTDIDAVTTELRNIRIQRQNVIKLAAGSLHQGLVNENSIQTSTALQVFVNLGTIKNKLEDLIKGYLDDCKDIIKSVLKISSSNKLKSSGSRITTSTSQEFRNKIWTELENSFADEMYNTCKQVKFLLVVVKEMHLKNPDPELSSQFWKNLSQLLKEELTQSSPAVIQALEDDYPKLLKIYCEMIKKLNYDEFKFDPTILKTLENSYLSGSLSRMSNPIQLMFSSENMPSQDGIDDLIRVITSEVSVALIEEHLSENISKNVVKCIKMLVAKMEQQIENGPEAAQVLAGSPNVVQQKNVQYCNLLHYMQLKTYRMLSNMKGSLSETCVQMIEGSLQAMTLLSGVILQPIVISINSIIETIIVTIHMEKDWARAQVTSNKNQSYSPYMKELTQFINRVYNTYLCNFQNKEVLSQKCNEIALRCIDLFILHSVLLRPISQAGRQRLQNDYNSLEQSLKIICPNLADLGRPYRIFKSMSLLVTLSPHEIIQGQTSGSSVPDSIVLLMLFSFAGPELASPHQNTGWSIPKLTTWLDEHPNEGDRLDLIAGALQRYEASTRQKNSVNYDPIYPLMSQFLEQIVKMKQVTH
ncbi:conserved oligomeric Golgi complex subunit 5 [Cylas formicarius]|uniref:conserved oligomeric Golgi complex subunit 5 n=1 Tax=Cylas formicarius TaxID=197179 RepID=UPI002958C509|nr:conserved oligomeric Golgi complex subunit 5 [Cylas formicarius]